MLRSVAGLGSVGPPQEGDPVQSLKGDVGVGWPVQRPWGSRGTSAGGEKVPKPGGAAGTPRVEAAAGAGLRGNPGVSSERAEVQGLLDIEC